MQWEIIPAQMAVAGKQTLQTLTALTQPMAGSPFGLARRARAAPRTAGASALTIRNGAKAAAAIAINRRFVLVEISHSSYA